MDIDIAKIYDSRTRQYVEEVISCYKTGCYRSAIVLLNSVCLSDLFYKLQELCEVYSDSKAKSIIDDIEEQINQDRTSPKWEKVLVDSIFNETSLLDNAAYTLLLHLRDYRNLTAHPVLDATSSLYQPSKELVESCISEAYNNILSRPSIFVKDIVAFMCDDLSQKRDFIAQDKHEFRKYVEQKYFQHMSDPMIVKVIRAIWKFTFILDNEDCNRNRKINFELISLLFDKYHSLALDDISTQNAKYTLGDHPKTILFLAIFLAKYQDVYPLLPIAVQQLLVKNIDNNEFIKFISWFTDKNKAEHIQKLIDVGFLYLPDSYERRYVESAFSETGEIDTLLKYYIHVARGANSFVMLNHVMDDYILPNLKKMHRDRLEDLIEMCNENNQAYWNYYFSGYCGKIWEQCKSLFDAEYIQDNFPRFKIPDTELDTGKEA